LVSLTILHNITNDAKLVKVAASSFGSEWLLERDLNVVDVIPVPSRTEKLVAESEDENVLDHLLAQVVINAVQLVLGPVWRECAL